MEPCCLKQGQHQHAALDLRGDLPAVRLRKLCYPALECGQGERQQLHSGLPSYALCTMREPSDPGQGLQQLRLQLLL